MKYVFFFMKKKLSLSMKIMNLNVNIINNIVNGEKYFKIITNVQNSFLFVFYYESVKSFLLT